MLGTVLVVSATVLAGCAVANQAPIPDNGPSAQALAPAALRDHIGIAAGNATLFEQNDAVRREALQAIADTGARWVTMDLDWNAVNGASPGDLRWDPTDLFVREARALGLSVIAIAAYSPAWARPKNCPINETHCLPASPETYATFVRLAAQRYGSQSAIPDLRNSILVWQIWNEPNHYPFVQPVVDVAYYTTMLKRAYVEIKKGDPASTVIAAGTAPAPDDPAGRNMKPTTFLRGIYANGGQGFFDAFGHHPYSFPCSPLVNAEWNAFTQTQYLHNVMVQNGDGGKKIWGTESGAPTGSNVGPCTSGPNVSVTEATQAQFVDDYIKGWTEDFGKFTGPLIWFQIRDNGTNRAFWDDNLGLLRRDFSPKPAYQRMKQRLAG
jgi:polysaccharide biosynthesis protein PslG